MSKPNVQAAIEAVESKIEAIKNHCLCFRFIRNETTFWVTLSPGYGVDAVRAHFSRECSQSTALDRILAKLEQIWENNRLK